MIISSLKKINNFDVKRFFVFILVRQYLNIKKLFYFIFLSDNKPDFNLRSIIQPAQFVGRGKISIAKTSGIGVWPSPQLLSGYAYFEARGKNSLITIGERTFINNSATIIADRTFISIGDDCLIGQNVSIFDSDFHGVELENRYNGVYECSPVNVGNNVFIGANVTILKGVTVGDGSVIGNGSIVIDDVMPMSIYVGVPARFIKEIK